MLLNEDVILKTFFFKSLILKNSLVSEIRQCLHIIFGQIKIGNPFCYVTGLNALKILFRNKVTEIDIALQSIISI